MIRKTVHCMLSSRAALLALAITLVACRGDGHAPTGSSATGRDDAASPSSTADGGVGDLSTSPADAAADAPDGTVIDGAGADGALAMDNNGNGVRDDVDQWLAGRASDAPEVAQALQGVAIAMGAMIRSTDGPTAANAAQSFLLARECVYLAKLGRGRWSADGIASTSDLLGELRAIVLNSWPNTEGYLEAHQRVSGASFTLASPEALAGPCASVGKVTP